MPGVAIATALMPPLCTAGYGIAMGSLRYFLGAMYLFSINAYFICLSTCFVMLTLKVPVKSSLNELKILFPDVLHYETGVTKSYDKHTKQTKQYLTTTIIISKAMLNFYNLNHITQLFSNPVKNFFFIYDMAFPFYLL